MSVRRRDVVDGAGEQYVQDMLRFTQFAVDSLSDAAYWVEKDARIIYVNEAACRITGYTREELLGMYIYELNPDIDSASWSAVWTRLTEARRRTFQTHHQAKDGRVFPVEIAANLLEFDGKEYSCAFARDITERVEMELRVRQAEKLEAVGQLAGGVAHDFNNQLLGIMGYTEILRERVADDPKAVGFADRILDISKRAADLTEQLLAFARRGHAGSEIVDVHRLVRDVVDMLSRSIDKRIAIETERSEADCVVRGDAAQLQSAVLNLALNGRDAMPSGGTLTFRTEIVELDTGLSSDPPFEVAPGRYVRLAVCDTGTGMDDETRRHIFEPFFTTKEKGKGTGLGLAAVYGAAKTHGGAITVESAPDAGTRACLYLPLAEGGATSLESVDEPGSIRGSPHVLLVEDEPALREVVQLMIERSGCQVTPCEHGADAVERFRQSPGAFDLVILDMVMPVMGGAEAYRAIRAIDPDVRVLLATGYSVEGEARALLDEGVLGLIRKPFTRAALTAKIGEILGTSQGPVSE